MSEWQLIETAPKDGTKVDLWVIERFVRRTERNTNGERLTDCCWQEPTKLHEGQDVEEAWVWYCRPHWEYVEMELEGGSRFVTHWMPSPEPPDDSSATT